MRKVRSVRRRGEGGGEFPTGLRRIDVYQLGVHATRVVLGLGDGAGGREGGRVGGDGVRIGATALMAKTVPGIMKYIVYPILFI